MLQRDTRSVYFMCILSLTMCNLYDQNMQSQN